MLSGKKYYSILKCYKDSTRFKSYLWSYTITLFFFTRKMGIINSRLHGYSEAWKRFLSLSLTHTHTPTHTTQTMAKSHFWLTCELTDYDRTASDGEEPASIDGKVFLIKVTFLLRSRRRWRANGYLREEEHIFGSGKPNKYKKCNRISRQFYVYFRRCVHNTKIYPIIKAITFSFPVNSLLWMHIGRVIG